MLEDSKFLFDFQSLQSTLELSKVAFDAQSLKQTDYPHASLDILKAFQTSLSSIFFFTLSQY